MCGRFAVFRSKDFMEKVLESGERPEFEKLWEDLYPNYNLAPSQYALDIREREDKREQRRTQIAAKAVRCGPHGSLPCRHQGE